ncbi:hypothetical protein MRX96_056165, partial [Rhipicephalus microplus]
SADSELAAPVVLRTPKAPAETHEAVETLSSARPTVVQEPGVQVEEPRENEASQNDRYCIVIWVTGAALAFPFVVAVWLLLVPFIVHSNVTIEPVLPDLRVTLFRTTALDPWRNTPPKCLVPVVLPALAAQLKVGPPYNANTTNLVPRLLFCLFNNTRVNSSSTYYNTTWHYVFEVLLF